MRQTHNAMQATADRLAAAIRAAQTDLNVATDLSAPKEWRYRGSVDYRSDLARVCVIAHSLAKLCDAGLELAQNL